MDTEIEQFYPTSRKDWRRWLKTNHRSKQSVWLVCYKKKSNTPTISWSHAVDEALCFGWIDSVRKSIDDEKFIQFFSKRKPNGTWSKVNKEKIKQLIDSKLMMPAGFESIERAKQNGSWTLLDEVEELIIPNDLEKELEVNIEAKDYFFSLSKSAKKILLHRLAFAKQKETRQKRINELVSSATQKRNPNSLDDSKKNPRD